MAKPTGRVLVLLEILQQGGQMTVADLARRVGVDQRTLRRYAAHLTDIGIPVESRRGRYGGYRLAPGYKLPPLMLTDDEAVAVVLGLAAGRRTGLGPAAAAAESAAAKLRRVLPTALVRRTDALLATIDFTSPARQAVPPGTEVLLVLAEAARERHPVRLTYTSWHGRDSERGLDPYGLVFHAGRWYVTGRDRTSRDVRTFRLDRIGAAHATDGTFEIPNGFDPTGHVIAGLAAVPYAHDISVRLHTDLAQAQRRIPPTVGTLVEVDDGVRLTTRVERLDGAAHMLVGLGWPFTIERPDELRDQVRLLAGRLLTHIDAGNHTDGQPAPATEPNDHHQDRQHDLGMCRSNRLLAGEV
ncbi:MAG: YafY family transcriptional regulator [Micromonosporaceae bacterium]|nr:YafY family transcriptional regulator [Micromonosporaceae bacterium]